MRIALVFALAAGVALAAPPRASRRKAPIPTPTAVPYFRAAGSCVGYELGRYVLLAEVGQGGRVFRLDEETVIATPLQKGARLRILYLETADGPLARRVLPGPVPVPSDAAANKTAGASGGAASAEPPTTTAPVK